MIKGNFFKNEAAGVAGFKMLSNKFFECNLLELKIILEYYRISVEEGYFNTLPPTFKELVTFTINELDKELPVEFKAMSFKFDIDKIRRVDNELQG